MNRNSENAVKYKVVKNPDCGKWMIMRFGNVNKDCMGDRWEQVCLSDKPAYTKYRKVALRWMLRLKEARGE